jgi:hypothetical protein
LTYALPKLRWERKPDHLLPLQDKCLKLYAREDK